jgi:predicted acyl esterase
MTSGEQRTFPVQFVRNVRIPMADGLTLAADLHLPAPAAAGTARFPAIIEYTPYHKNNNHVYGPRATRYPYFASHGYVFVNVDIRGTGDSEGFNTSPTSPEEVRDGLEVIRWCAHQSWCDGGVGMIGISYTAGVCYDAARAAPPELKAIILCQMCSDWYDGMACPGGSPRPFAYENYSPLMAAYNFAPPDPDLVGPRWSAIWQQRLENSVPWGHTYVENLLDSPFWESRLLRDHAEKVRAATFLIGGWCDWYPDDFLRVYSKLRCPKKILVGPWTHNYPENAWPLPRINDRHECLRWFDRHLKGIDTDPSRPLDREPPVTLFVREYTRPEPLRREDAGQFQHEKDWPPAHVHVRSLPLTATPHTALPDDPHRADGQSDLVYRPDVGVAAGRYAIGQMLPGWGMGDDQRLDEAFSLVWTFALAEPVELLGAPVAHLWLACTAEVAFVSVKLCDVAPDGTSALITKGVLNLTHRHSRQRPELLEPGKVYAIEVPLQAAAHHFRPGHRLRLMVACVDFQNAWPTPLPHTLTVYHGPDFPSRVDLPLGGQRDPGLPEPVFLPSEFPPLPPEQIPTPDYAILRDLIRKTATVQIKTLSGIGINRSSYTVRIDRPAEAAVVSEFEYPMDRPGLSIRVRSQCTTRSDEKALHQTTQVEITINGWPHWSKSWSVSAPRVGW